MTTTNLNEMTYAELVNWWAGLKAEEKSTHNRQGMQNLLNWVEAMQKQAQLPPMLIDHDSLIEELRDLVDTDMAGSVRSQLIQEELKWRFDDGKIAVYIV